jgi:hypothetical protein
MCFSYSVDTQTYAQPLWVHFLRYAIPSVVFVVAFLNWVPRDRRILGNVAFINVLVVVIPKARLHNVLLDRRVCLAVVANGSFNSNLR